MGRKAYALFLTTPGKLWHDILPLSITKYKPMILLEQYIELQIYHGKELRKYDVVELLKDDEGMSFKISYKGDYVFTLIPTMKEFLCFKLSAPNKMMRWDLSLYLKIEASLFSIFLKNPDS